jgi:peptidoglycan hydrolase CwlO-like protein
MIKKILTYSLLFFIITSCSASKESEETKSGNASQRSGRINSSESNTKDIFKELD